MDFHLLPYIMPLCIALVFSILIVIHIFKYRRIPGAEFLIIMSLIMAVWSSGYIFEVLSSKIEEKIFWDNIQMLTGALGTACFGFALQYTKQRSRLTIKEYVLLSIEPVTIWILAVTDITTLFRQNPRIYMDGPIPGLTYELNSLFWVDLIYGYVMYFLFVGIMIKFLINTHSLYRKQVVTILIGVTVTAVGLIMFLLGLTPKYMRDPVPVTFTILNISIALSIYRYKFLNVVPIAKGLIFEKLNTGLIIIDNNKLVIDMNKLAKNIVKNNNKNIIGEHIGNVFPKISDKILNINDKTCVKFEIDVENQNEKVIYDVDIFPILKKERIHVGWIISFDNISKRKRLENELQASEEKYRNVSEFANDGIAIIQDGLVKYVNKKIIEMLKITYKDIINEKFEIFIIDSLRHILRENYIKRLKGEEVSPRYETVLQCKDGTTLDVEINAAIMNYNGKIATLAYIRDITERKRAERILKDLARKDPLTHIFNRRHFFTLAEKEFNKSLENKKDLYAIMIDVDYFKKVNDKYGHIIGDRVLCSVANCIESSIRKTDICCRYGGEEFAILLTETDFEKAKEVAEKVRKTIMKTVINTEKGDVSVTVSLGGVGTSNEIVESVDKLFNRADELLYEAKETGRNRAMLR